MTRKVSLGRSDGSAPVDVYELAPDECVAVGSGGLLWRLSATLDDLDGDAGRALLITLGEQSHAEIAIPWGSDGIVAPSASDLEIVAVGLDEEGGVARDVLFPYAGHWHRLRLSPGTAVGAARTAVDCLLSTIPDPATAAALLGPPSIRSDGWSIRADASAPATADVLERWDGNTWIAHVLDPAPIIDPVTGILHSVRRRRNAEPVPAGFAHLHAELPHLRSVDVDSVGDALAPAGALDTADSTPRELLEPGILSGVAHYCGTDLGQGRRTRASADEFGARGERWFDLRTWEPHDPRLHDFRGFPFSRFDPSRVDEWIQGRDAWGDVWVPSSLVFAGYASRGSSPPTNAMNLVGLHAGRTADEATERAVAHVIAHDAVAVWWSSTAVASAAAIPARAVAVMDSSRLDLRVLAIRSTLGVPVRLAVVDDPVDGVVSLGFAAHIEPDRAAELAVVEALIQHVSARDLASGSSLIRDSAELGNGAVAGLVPFDPHRRYAAAFGADHRGLIDPMAHVQFGLDPSVVERVRARTRPSGTHPEETGATESGPSADGIVATVAARGRIPTVVDVTTDRVRSTDYRAVRAILPGLARLQPAAFPLDPTGRLARARKELEWKEDWAPLPYPGW